MERRSHTFLSSRKVKKPFGKEDQPIMHSFIFFFHRGMRERSQRNTFLT
jgi:hypothetical protein